MTRLLLFDVDGTLMKRGDPDHLAAIDQAVHEVFPDSRSATVHNVDYDGKVDRLIATEVLAQAGISISVRDPMLDGVFDRAGEWYRERWAEKSGGSEDLLPGVAELMPTLVSNGGFALGVMTGGSRAIVSVKLERLGLTEFFPVGSFGNEVPDRPSLVPVALERAHSYYGEEFLPEMVVVVGDTPADVHCAHVHGIPCLGVATGKYTMDQLREAGADEVVPDLAEIDLVQSVLLTLSYTNH